VAAGGYRQIDPEKKYDNVFVIGSSHYASFIGASIYDIGNYATPLGKVKVNIDLARKLIHENPVFTFNADADRNEHCLEVQVPFLQYYLKKDFQLVPVVIGSQSAETCKKIAAALKPYFGGNNLFVFSTDFSHYPSYSDAQSMDKKTCDAILSGSADKLLDVLGTNEKAGIPNLATSLCGWTSVLTLLSIVGNDPQYELKAVDYRNSGDSKYGDKVQVVGYWAIAVTQKAGKAQQDAGFVFSTDDKKQLLAVARITIERYLRDRKKPEIVTTGFSHNLMMHCGAFVTLTENGELRGCIGRFTADEPLYKVVQEMAIASSTEDTRFQPVTVDEIPKLKIEISVLSPMKKIQSIDEIILGKHGIYIKKGWASGTFLPQVATGTGWTKEEFLGHCARDKAGIGWDGWKTADIYTYEALVFSEPEVSGRKEK
jgi:MEMO1 family protein